MGWEETTVPLAAPHRSPRTAVTSYSAPAAAESAWGVQRLPAVAAPQRRGSGCGVLVVRGSGYLGQHLIAVLASTADHLDVVEEILVASPRFDNRLDKRW
ncbi:unnamed protein product [Urochloa humidicola]